MRGIVFKGQCALFVHSYKQFDSDEKLNYRSSVRAI